MPGGSALWSTTTTRQQVAETLVTWPPIDVRDVSIFWTTLVMNPLSGLATSKSLEI
jgi:hypothetical protein